VSTLTLSGRQKAAIVVAQLDDDRATKVLKAMTEAEVVELMAEVASLPPLAPDVVRAVVEEFLREGMRAMQVRQGGLDAARRLLTERLGHARAEEILHELSGVQLAHPLAFLNRLEPTQLASFLAEEQPQTIAVVLAHLYSDRAAAVLAHLDETTRVEVTRRLATMGRIPPDVVAGIAEVLERKLAGLVRAGATPSHSVGGIESVVGILNASDRATEKQILSELEAADPELAERIRNEMFVFDDVVRLDDRTLQKVLRHVVPKDLAVALKGVGDEVRDKFLRNMSERAAADLLEEIEILGPTRVSAVEAAQTAVTRVVRELEAEGEIVLLRGDDELVV
jgi:flagellar motor switch protein FliG